MIYELFDFFYSMCSSADYNIQKHSFYFLFPSCIVDMFEDKSKSLKILFLLEKKGVRKEINIPNWAQMPPIKHS